MIINLVHCAHCGRLHVDVRFEPTGDGRFWSVCPKTGGVIWLNVTFGSGPEHRQPGPSETK